LYCFKDLLIVRALARLGLRTMLLPDAARLLVRPHPAKPHVDLLIACNLYPYRARLLEHLQEFSWEIYGNVPRWLRSPMVRFHKGKYLAGAEKVTAYQSAAIVFNSNHPAEVEGINARTFEVCGAGAFLLTDAHPALPSYYEPGIEVGVYNSVRDVAEVVRYYLGRPDLRYEMAERAYERTAREHTYECRIRTLLNELASPQ
jgi:spore maturation protein CgeB